MGTLPPSYRKWYGWVPQSLPPSSVSFYSSSQRWGWLRRRRRCRAQDTARHGVYRIAFRPLGHQFCRNESFIYVWNILPWYCPSFSKEFCFVSRPPGCHRHRPYAALSLPGMGIISPDHTDNRQAALSTLHGTGRESTGRTKVALTLEQQTC